MKTAEDTMIKRNLDYIKLEWADIHHSRQQEWSALIIVAGIFYAIAQVDLPDLDSLRGVHIFLGLTGVFSAFLGACISWQHHTILLQKIAVIVKLERQIGIEYPTRNVLFPVQVLIFLLFGGICSTFVGLTLGCVADVFGASHLRPWAYVIGVAIFLGGFVGFAFVHRRKAMKVQSYGFSHPFYAEMSDLGQCLVSLGDVPLKLIVGATFDQRGIKEVPWELPQWTCHQDGGNITKPVLLNRRDVFQFSLANASSRQDWHYHNHTFEVCVSDSPMDLDYEERGTGNKMHVNRGVLIVPPGIPHKISLSGSTFVFQATLAGQGLGEDKVVGES